MDIASMTKSSRFIQSKGLRHDPFAADDGSHIDISNDDLPF